MEYRYDFRYYLFLFYVRWFPWYLLPFKKTVVLIGMLKDKAIIETVEPFLPWIQDWYIAKLPSERGSDGVIIAEFLKTRDVKNCYTFESVDDALNAMNMAYCKNNWERALIFGSFYTIAATKNWILAKGEDLWKKK